MRLYLRTRERTAAFVAERLDGSLVGFVEVSLRPYDWPALKPKVGFLEGLYVLKASRRLGIARSLAKAAESWARAHGARMMGSDTHPENRPSRAAHRALGYRVSEQLIEFEKRLR
jgi:aminoglycoside 6'-N-acetyltransferase I